MKSPEIDNLFPGVNPSSLDKLKQVRFADELEKAMTANSGAPALMKMLEDEPNLSMQEIKELVHDLAEVDQGWAKSSEKLRTLFPSTQD
jgi:hypothetical protein